MVDLHVFACAPQRGQQLSFSLGEYLKLEDCDFEQRAGQVGQTDLVTMKQDGDVVPIGLWRHCSGLTLDAAPARLIETQLRRAVLGHGLQNSVPACRLGDARAPVFDTCG